MTNSLTDFQYYMNKCIDASKQYYLDTKKARASEKHIAGCLAKGWKSCNTFAATNSASGSNVTLNQYGSSTTDMDVIIPSSKTDITHPRVEERMRGWLISLSLRRLSRPNPLIRGKERRMGRSRHFALGIFSVCRVEKSGIKL